MKRINLFSFILPAFLSITLCSCGDQKSPIKGYITNSQVTEIVKAFEESSTYSKVEVDGSINYFNLSDKKIPTEISETMVYSEYPIKTDNKSENDYLSKCASYYLRLPLHINYTSWSEKDTDWQSKYQLESKLIRLASNSDKLYYYNRDEGGFIVRTFAANKELKINNNLLYEEGVVETIIDLECSGKWNISIEYDKNGYLIKETFETVNAPQNKSKASASQKSQCVYAQANYEYF